MISSNEHQACSAYEQHPSGIDENSKKKIIQEHTPLLISPTANEPDIFVLLMKIIMPPSFHEPRFSSLNMMESMYQQRRPLAL